MKKIILFLLAGCLVLQSSAQLGKKLNNSNNGAAGNMAGTWVNVTNGQTITLLFYDNGSGEFEGEQISWQAANGKLTMKGGGSGMVYNYKLNGNTLILSGGDLSKPASFTRNGGADEGNSNPAGFNQPATKASNDLLGSWSAQNMVFTFMSGGKMTYNDKTMDYTVNGNRLHCENAAAGVTVDYEYEISQGHLLLKYNGNTLMLQRKGGNTGGNATANGNKPATGNNLFGDWVSQQNEHLSLMQGGRMTLEGYELTYTCDANTITVNAPAGKVVFTYKLSGNSLAVTNNGITSYYTRAGAAGNTGNGGTNGYGNAGGGSIDATMVGTWQRMGASGGGYNSNGSSQYSEYFVLHANGTYEYHSESSRSANGNDQYGNEVFRGSAAGEGNDRGTWRVQGNTIIATSQTKGVVYYPFQKRNNKYGDPCIVIDGTEYVTSTQRAPW